MKYFYYKKYFEIFDICFFSWQEKKCRKWKQTLRLIRATCIMKQDIIIHKCMTEFAAKDSIWGANLSSWDGIECTYTCCGGCQPLNWKGTFFLNDTRYRFLVSIRYWSSFKRCLHKSAFIVIAFTFNNFFDEITNDCNYTWMSTEEYILKMSQYREEMDRLGRLIFP